MKRETPEELALRMRAAAYMVPAGYTIRHVETGGEYIVRGHCLRVGDLMPMVNYSPITGPVIVFSRAAQDIQSKFVRMDGEGWKSVYSMSQSVPCTRHDGKPCHCETCYPYPHKSEE